jgi:hypothetical protein
MESMWCVGVMAYSKQAQHSFGKRLLLVGSHNECNPRTPGTKGSSKIKEGMPLAATTQETWLSELRRLPEKDEAATTVRGILTSHPQALLLQPTRLLGVTDLLLRATRRQRLYRRWFYPAAVVCSIAALWAPDELDHALRQLDSAVLAALDGLLDGGDLLVRRLITQ